MNITLNGERTTLEAPISIQQFLIEQGYGEKTAIAIAVNGTFVPRQDHANTNIKDGDDVEIVAPMQGG